MAGGSAKKGKKKGKAAQKGPVQLQSLISSPMSQPGHPSGHPSATQQSSRLPTNRSPLDAMAEDMMEDIMARCLMSMMLGGSPDSSPTQPHVRRFRTSPAYDPSALQPHPNTCAQCGADTPSPVKCENCDLTSYCSKLHRTAHQHAHTSACCVLRADAAAAHSGAPLTDLVHAALLRLLYDPHRVVASLQALLHVLDDRLGHYTALDLRDSPSYSRLQSLMRRHGLYRRGSHSDTPLESCKLATTVLLVMCAQLDQGVVANVVAAASWLSQSKGAFRSCHLSRCNAKDKTLRVAVKEALRKINDWHLQAGTEGPPINGAETASARRGVCIAVGLTDCVVFRMPWLQGIAHHFALVLSQGPGPIDSATGEHRDNAHSGEEDFSAVSARLFQAYGPPDIGYSLRDNVFEGTGSKSMSIAEVWDFVSDLERLQACSTWHAAKPLYVRLFAAEPKLEARHPCELNVRTFTSFFSEDSLRCMSRMHAALLEIPYAELP